MPTHSPAAANVRLSGKPTWPPPPTTTTSRFATSVTPRRLYQRGAALVHPPTGVPGARLSGGDDRDDDLLESPPGIAVHDARGIELTKRLVAVAAGLVPGVVAGARPLEDLDDRREVVRAGGVVPVQGQQPFAVVRPGVLEGVDEREGLLPPGEVGRLLAGRLLLAPDPQQVVVELEGEAQG